MATAADTTAGFSITGYRIGGVLGEGAGGVVVRGVQELTGRPVAIKILPPGALPDAEAAAALEREAAILERFSHPGIVSLADHGRTDAGLPFLAFELVNGQTLAEVIESGEEVPPARALGWMIQAAEALAAAWSRKVIHRDVKPGNMMIDERGNLRLMDFGTAGLAAPEPGTGGSEGRRRRGSPRYISPEAALGNAADPRGDVYSLGASFYHLMVGQPPFQAARTSDLLDMHVRAALPSPASIRPDLPGDVCDILEHMLRKDPAARYQTWEDLLDDLREALLALCVAGGPTRAPAFTPATLTPAPVTPAAFAPPAFIPPPTLGARPYGEPGTGSWNGPPYVHTPYEPLELPPPKRFFTASRLLMFSIPPLVLLGLVLFLPSGGEGGGQGEQNWLARRLGAMLLFENPEEPDPEREWLELRAENVDRLERAMSALIWQEINHPERPLALEELVRTGALNENMLIDVWGNPFTFSRGAMTLRSAGPDGIEDTYDDFVMDRNLSMGHDPDSDPRRNAENSGTRSAGAPEPEAGGGAGTDAGGGDSGGGETAAADAATDAATDGSPNATRREPRLDDR